MTEVEYAEKELSKGYFLYIYESTDGDYKFKAVDPKYYKSLENFKKVCAFGGKLYSSFDEVSKELKKLNGEP